MKEDFKLMSCKFHLTERTKRELYELLLYKVKEGIATINELNILQFLECDEDVERINQKTNTKWD